MTDHRGEAVDTRPWDGRCHMLIRWPNQVRCGRPEDHERHVPGTAGAHVYSPAPPDMDDPYEYDEEAEHG